MQKLDHNEWIENPLWYLIQKYPEKPWNWFWISHNPNITWEHILINPEKPWNWK